MMRRLSSSGRDRTGRTDALDLNVPADSTATDDTTPSEATGLTTMASPTDARPSLIGLGAEPLTAWFRERGLPTYRAAQVGRWIYRRRATDFDQMTDLPRSLRDELAKHFQLFTTEVAQHNVAPDGTHKLLLACHDARRIECVLMFGPSRRTVCFSTQVGCAMGCVFCASGLRGVERNLTSGEMIEQVLRAEHALPIEERVSHLVVMGMGESLANFDPLIAALDRICSPDGLGLSPRRVTISTVGLPEKIRRLAALDRPYHLAVSLHAPTEALRDELVPVNAKVGLHAVLEASDEYFARTGRQITFEYVLLHGVNDRPEHARALTDLLNRRKAHVNLIPYNPVEGLPYQRPSPRAIDAFVATLRRGRVSVTVRKTKGRPIDAACGQLRRRAEDGSWAAARARPGRTPRPRDATESAIPPNVATSPTTSTAPPSTPSRPS